MLTATMTLSLPLPLAVPGAVWDTSRATEVQAVEFHAELQKQVMREAYAKWRESSIIGLSR